MERAGTVVLSEWVNLAKGPGSQYPTCPIMIMFRLVNSNQERLKFFQELQDERREEIISIMMEDIDLIVFHLEEQDTIR